MDPSHFAVIRSSGRKIPVVRMGRLLVVLHLPRRGQQPVSTCRYDRRFWLLPRPEGGIAPGDAWSQDRPLPSRLCFREQGD
jgi:hypothetical protein